ncbi:MAG: hypothetical protein BroJett018_22070 [Chloroflexota bacterium]|nr:hypothetical protein [Chloroflexota bacterium]NOG66106.1 hypothetical protein [Chloroflexota bacterium]GIK64413.1 MAG: hypothetical protein BroJett018_22070 [Chloroflexota bacterium]
MSLLLPDDDWLIEEPPDNLFDTFEEEPPEWDFKDATPPEPPDFPPMDDEREAYAPPIPSAQDYVVPEALYADELLKLPAEVYPTQTTHPPASETLVIERPSTWRLQQSGVLIEEVFADAPDPDHYAVGIMEVWHDPQTGDQKGAYLHMADAPHLERAEEMRNNIYRMADEARVSDPDLGNFAHGLIQQRGEWWPLTDAQWEVVDNTLTPDMPDFQAEATWVARDQLLAQTVAVSGAELAREEIDQPHELQAVMRGLGLQAEDFDPASIPPPLFDESTNTAYWIGVYQPDPNNSNEAITSILSIHQDEAGQPIAHLAPVATGDWNHAYRTAEYLLGVAERTQDVGQVLDTAEAMALATQQRDLWGTPLEADVAFSPVGMELD